MNAFLKIAYQPYKWLVVIPFVFFITMLLGLICIVVGFVFSQDAADILAVTWSRLCCAIAPLRVIIQGKKIIPATTPMWWWPTIKAWQTSR